MFELLPIVLIAGLGAALVGQARAEESRLTCPRELTDRQLWRLVEGGADVLAGMPFDEAARMDPRRVYAGIQQVIGAAMKQALPDDPMSRRLREALWLRSMLMIRTNFNGGVPLEALVSLQEESWSEAMLAGVSMWPPFARRAVLDQWPMFDRAFALAAGIADRAREALVFQGDNDGAALWRAMSDLIEEMGDGLRDALTGGAPAALGAPPRRRLPGPEGFGGYCR